MAKFRIFRKAHEMPIILENTYQNNEVTVNVTNDYNVTISAPNLTYTMQVEETENKEVEIIYENEDFTISEKSNIVNVYGLSSR